MEPKQKTVTFALWAVLVAAMVAVAIGAILRPRSRSAQSDSAGAVAMLSSDGQPGDSLHPLFDAPELNLTDQDGRKFSTRDLRGHPWVADFIFTSCAGSCPIMSHKLAEVQKRTPAQVELVSFTVDPQHDTPAILKEYARSLNADASRWHFLTGTAGQMADAAYGMKISVKPASGDEPLLHSQKFLLIDQAGKVVGIYDGTSADEVKKLEADAAQLARRGSRGS